MTMWNGIDIFSHVCRLSEVASPRNQMGTSSRTDRCILFTYSLRRGISNGLLHSWSHMGAPLENLRRDRTSWWVGGQVYMRERDEPNSRSDIGLPNFCPKQKPSRTESEERNHHRIWGRCSVWKCGVVDPDDGTRIPTSGLRIAYVLYQKNCSWINVT